MKRSYIIKLNDKGYYKAESAYCPVIKSIASILDRKQAQRIKSALRKLGYNPIIENYN